MKKMSLFACLLLLAVLPACEKLGCKRERSEPKMETMPAASVSVEEDQRPS